MALPISRRGEIRKGAEMGRAKTVLAIALTAAAIIACALVPPWIMRVQDEAAFGVPHAEALPDRPTPLAIDDELVGRLAVIGHVGEEGGYAVARPVSADEDHGEWVDRFEAVCVELGEAGLIALPDAAFGGASAPQVVDLSVERTVYWDSRSTAAEATVTVYWAAVWLKEGSNASADISVQFDEESGRPVSFVADCYPERKAQEEIEDAGVPAGGADAVAAWFAGQWRLPLEPVVAGAESGVTTYGVPDGDVRLTVDVSEAPNAVRAYVGAPA